jgi:hypothetical protein
MTTSLSYSTNSTADQEKKSVSNCRIESFIYLCNHELRFGLESIGLALQRKKFDYTDLFRIFVD